MSLLGGLLFVFNPYAFERLGAGQWASLAGFWAFPGCVAIIHQIT
jgi:hypothetical protein